MNGKLVSKMGWVSALILAATVGGSSASAYDPQIVLTVSGLGPTPHPTKVTSVTGGTTSGGKSVSTPSGGVTTASISVPLVITRSDPDRELLRFAAVGIMNPNAFQNPAVRAQTFDQTAASQWKITQDKEFDKVVPTRLEIPGTFGPVSQRGNFVITANVLTMHNNTPSAVLVPALPNTETHSAYPAYWAVRLNGLSSTPGSITFEPFSLTPQQTTLALTLHSDKVTTADLTNWVKTHPNGEATLEWVQTGSIKNTQLFGVGLKNVVLGSTTNDTTGQPAITAHLTGTISSLIAQ